MGKQVLLESNEEWMPASLCSKNDEGNMTFWVSNWRNEPLLIKKNQIVGVVSREWKVYEGKEGKEVNMLDIDKKPSLKGEWRKKEVERLLNENGEIPSGIFRRIISECSEVFAIEDSELTQTGMVECKIELEKNNPICQKCRPVPLALQEKVKQMLKDMEARKIIKIGNGKSLWVPWEQIRVVPKEVPEVKIETKAKRGRRAMQKDVVNQVHIWEKDNFSVENMKFAGGKSCTQTRVLSASTYQRHGTPSRPPYTPLSATNKISLKSRRFHAVLCHVDIIYFERPILAI
uniref:Uncharacterized protein n=1 Tax=Caenorhabditis japonica TaxID=281687 RepID=A0A8R1IVT4_CAEJA